MAKTYEDFLETVTEDNLEFVNTMHQIFLDNGCKIEVKEAKQGYVVTYFYMKDKKRVSVINYVFRKSGMITRIYARHVHMYQDILDTIPEVMKKETIKGLDCKRLNKISECSPTCTAGYEFVMDGVTYKKCKNSAFFWLINDETKESIRKVIEGELKFLDVEL